MSITISYDLRFATLPHGGKTACQLLPTLINIDPNAHWVIYHTNDCPLQQAIISDVMHAHNDRIQLREIVIEWNVGQKQLILKNTNIKVLLMKEIEVRNEPIELYKLLKFAGLAQSGGEAKVIIADEQVLVNGNIETKKRKKIVTGDVISYQDEQFTIRLV
jgi:ribosome-associated protein